MLRNAQVVAEIDRIKAETASSCDVTPEKIVKLLAADKG
jgi:hypothetical protein